MSAKTKKLAMRQQWALLLQGPPAGFPIHGKPKPDEKEERPKIEPVKREKRVAAPEPPAPSTQAKPKPTKPVKPVKPVVAKAPAKRPYRPPTDELRKKRREFYRENKDRYQGHCLSYKERYIAQHGEAAWKERQRAYNKAAKERAAAKRAAAEKDKAGATGAGRRGTNTTRKDQTEEITDTGPFLPVLPHVRPVGDRP